MLGLVGAKGEEIAPGPALGRDEFAGRRAGGKEFLLKGGDMAVNQGRGDSFSFHQAKHGQQSVNPGRIEGSSPEPVPAVSVLDRSTPLGQVGETRKPTRVDRSLAEAREGNA